MFNPRDRVIVVDALEANSTNARTHLGEVGIVTEKDRYYQEKPCYLVSEMPSRTLWSLPEHGIALYTEGLDILLNGRVTINDRPTYRS